MAVFTVTGVHDKKEWDGKFGPMVSYVLDLTDENGSEKMDVELNRKPESREPQVQERFVGHLEPGPYGEKLKIDFEATKELNKGGGYEASSGTSAPSQNSSKGSAPGRDIDASIARQVALKIVAPVICEERGLTSAPREMVREIEQFILEAGKTSQGAGAGTTGGGSPTPSSVRFASAPPSEEDPDFSGARRTEPNSIDRDHIMQLLDSAGLVYAAAQEKVADFIMGPLTVEGRADKALSGLQDLDRQGNTLAQLKKSTEGWIGSPLPQGDALDGADDVPF